jgi:hypothetical protein
MKTTRNSKNLKNLSIENNLFLGESRVPQKITKVLCKVHLNDKYIIIKMVHTLKLSKRKIRILTEYNKRVREKVRSENFGQLSKLPN